MRKLIYPNNIPLTATAGSIALRRNIIINKRRINRFLEAPTGTKPRLVFPGYTNNSLKTAVRLVACGCCGYCGRRVEGTATVTVEHFRPKAKLQFQIEPLNPYRVHESYKVSGLVEKTTFGYYQEGDNSRNMIPACNSCNSGQGNSGMYVSKKVDGRKITGVLEYKFPFGKNNFFPLYKIQRLSGNLIDTRIGKDFVLKSSVERPLLFNPYIDNPEEIFEYKKMSVSEQTNHAFIQVRPIRKSSKYQKLKAQASICLLGLNRKELCHERAHKYEKLLNLTKEVVRSNEDSDWRPDVWSRYSRCYANEFSMQSSNLIGYGMNVEVGLGFFIRKIIVENLVCHEVSNFTTGIDFFEMVKEHALFSQAVKTNLSGSDLNTDIAKLMALVELV